MIVGSSYPNITICRDNMPTGAGFIGYLCAPASPLRIAQQIAALRFRKASHVMLKLSLIYAKELYAQSKIRLPSLVPHILIVQ
jgi:hypothetical protein